MIKLPPHLSKAFAVAFIKDPLPAVVAVGDQIFDHILGIEHLLGSLSCHLADHNWPLEVYLCRGK